MPAGRVPVTNHLVVDLVLAQPLWHAAFGFVHKPQPTTFVLVQAASFVAAQAATVEAALAVNFDAAQAATFVTMSREPLLRERGHRKAVKTPTWTYSCCYSPGYACGWSGTRMKERRDNFCWLPALIVVLPMLVAATAAAKLEF